ncbi:thiamine pyrophosphokinase 1-like protein [Gorgonomyces haynaldii]|nr:thiamine pyrophosphokinase 1-like protein [Gorgonomyces haynaldii]
MHWSTQSLFEPHILLILNQPLPHPTLLQQIVQHSKYIICADGGANRLRPYGILPHHILGDLDSLTPENRDYYTSKGVSIEKSHDQDSTDFQKCLNKIESLYGKSETVLALGALSGRLDQIMSSMHTLFNNPIKTLLVSNESIAFLLEKGEHTLHILPWEGPSCGLFPLTSDNVLCSSKGLVWDMDNLRLGFGHLISTSNVIQGSGNRTVQVLCSDRLMWSVQVDLTTEHGFK